ncbi:HutD family protein [Pelagibius sp. 7325]|uniref:HutD/Ves family protein n=1 Tax=Pelagibius sp. 7325 TaxID=3131994 RepID=UPI0030EF3E67
MPTRTTRRILVSDIAAAPWKNGGGVTREIATGASPGAGADPDADWGWRVSLAEVARDGPFSLFPDTDRVIAVIDGAGMDLIRPDGSILPLDPLQPVRFAGEAPLSGRLRSGPVRDLNAMVRRGRFAAQMEILQGPSSVSFETGDHDCLLVLTLIGSCAVRLEGDESHDLAPAEVLIHEGTVRADVQPAANGRAAVIRIAAQ